MSNLYATPESELEKGTKPRNRKLRAIFYIAFVLWLLYVSFQGFFSLYVMYYYDWNIEKLVHLSIWKLVYHSLFVISMIVVLKYRRVGIRLALISALFGFSVELWFGDYRYLLALEEMPRFVLAIPFIYGIKKIQDTSSNSTG